MARRMPRTLCLLFSAVCVVAGIYFSGGGIWLLTKGGSPYYLVAGIAFVAVGVLLVLRNPWALWMYTAIILGTMVWALWEVGIDWWQLAPRGDVVVILGVFLSWPWVAVGAKSANGRDQAIFKSGWLALVASIALSGVVAVLALATTSHDLQGSLPDRTAAIGFAPQPSLSGGEWIAYGGTQAGQRYSPLKQITPENVKQLQVVWSYHTGDIRGPNDPVETTYEVTPLMIGGTVYLCTPHDLVIALDAETGTEKWRFDPKIKQPNASDTQHLTCRGVSYFDGGSSAPTMASITASAAAAPACMRRLFLPTVDGRLIALSADTGVVCPGFGGDDGTVDLWRNMPNVTPGAYYSTSPPVVTSHLIIVGGAVNDNVSTTEPSGVIRAYDVNTGELVWNWDSLNPEATSPIGANENYRENSPNSWSVSSYDPVLGLIYVPMGNEPPDQFGGKRDKDAETYSSSVVALNAETGKVAWVFQGAHHDLWDMDIPAQPSRIDLSINGNTVPALVASTKQGEIFVLDRRTGTPVLPVTEVRAPQGAAKGDFSAPTQPVSAISFNPAPLTEASMWGLSPFDQLACRIAFRSLRYDGRYTPPSLQGSIIYPGNFGTFNWGGVAVDPERQIVFAMPTYIAFTSTLKVRKNDTERLVSKPGEPAFNENFGAPYAAAMGPFLSPLGFPCQAPPWGYVAAADLTTGKIAYQRVNGTIRDLSPVPLPLKMGVPGLGGPVVTKGGVAFLSGTLDYFVRAYDVKSGAQLWEDRLPAGGQATPMNYWSEQSGRQFLIVVAGGHGSSGTKAGDSIIAYALPKDQGRPGPSQ
jgi:quinoprotein glucose dehydrogenase